MEVQSKEVYDAIKEVLAECRTDYKDTIRIDPNARISKAYTYFIFTIHDPVKLVEEYMFIQNKVSKESATTRKIILSIFKLVIRKVIVNQQEKEARDAKLKETVDYINKTKRGAVIDKLKEV